MENVSDRMLGNRKALSRDLDLVLGENAGSMHRTLPWNRAMGRDTDWPSTVAGLGMIAKQCPFTFSQVGLPELKHKNT